MSSSSSIPSSFYKIRLGKSGQLDLFNYVERLVGCQRKRVLIYVTGLIGSGKSHQVGFALPRKFLTPISNTRVKFCLEPWGMWSDYLKRQNEIRFRDNREDQMNQHLIADACANLLVSMDRIDYDVMICERSVLDHIFIFQSYLSSDCAKKLQIFHSKFDEIIFAVLMPGLDTIVKNLDDRRACYPYLVQPTNQNDLRDRMSRMIRIAQQRSKLLGVNHVRFYHLDPTYGQLNELAKDDDDNDTATLLTLISHQEKRALRCLFSAPDGCRYSLFLKHSQHHKNIFFFSVMSK